MNDDEKNDDDQVVVDQLQNDQQQNPIPSYSFDLFDVVYFGPHRGYGCIATQDIPPLTLIWEEEPLLDADVLAKALDVNRRRNHHGFSSPSHHDDDDAFLRDECHISQQNRQRLWMMHDQYALTKTTDNETAAATNNVGFHDDDDGTNNNKTIAGIVRSNAFTDLQGRPVLYYISAKFNHSCRPNVGYDFVVESSTKHRLFTTRSVPKGHELFDCYSDVVYYFPTDIRQIYLYEKHNFLCHCQRCCPRDGDDDNDDNHEEEEDSKRERLLEIARFLSNQLEEAKFLYSPEFENQVWKTISDDDHDDKDTQQHPNHHRNRRTECTSCTPIRKHLDAILEYLDILKDLGIDHDCLDSYELAFDLAVFLDERLYLQQFQLGQICWKMYQVRKGINDPDTLTFQQKWHAVKNTDAQNK